MLNHAITTSLHVKPILVQRINKDSQLNVYASDKHFQIELKASNFDKSQPLVAEYIRHLEHLEPDYYLPEENFEEDLLEELANWALECFVSISQKIPPLDAIRNYTLHDCLFPEVFHYSLYAAERNLLFPVLLDRSGSERLMGALLPESEQLDDSTQVSDAGDVNSTCRELKAYAKIQSASFFLGSINTCRLLGIVQIPSSDRIVGLLLPHIESDNGRTLLYTGKDPRYDVSMRQKWLT